MVAAFLAFLVGMTSMQQMFQPHLTAAVVAGNQLTQSAAANQATIKAVAKVSGKAALSPPATTTRLTLSVSSARQSTLASGPKKGQAIGKYNWLINADNSGDPGQGSSALVKYTQKCDGTQPAAADCPAGNDGLLARNADVCHPQTVANPSGNPGFNDPAKPLGMACQWPSIHRADSPPVVSEGTQADWNASTPLPVFDAATGRGLPPGKYLVSVTADGYTLGGIHFSSPMVAPGVVDVGLNPYPIPLGNMVLKAFKDMTPTDGQWDVSKPGLAGFQPQVSDPDGVVTVDYFGNPLCTQYVKNGAGKVVLSALGKPQPLARTGNCVTDANGDVTIPNLAPNRYSIRMLQPNGSDWVQTTTLEGNHDYDVWIMPNDTGLDTEMVVAGEATPFVNIGFVKPTAMTLTGSGRVTGRVAGAAAYMPGQGALPGLGLATGTSGIKLLDKPLPHTWISLADMNNSDQVFYAGETAADGGFNVSGLPKGDYQITAWDQPQDYELDAFQFSVTAEGQVVDVGVVPLLGWWAHVYGHVFVDLNGNGRQDPGEPGIPKLPVQNLNRTNNNYQGGINVAQTDFAGFYDMKQAYSLGQFTVNQAFFTRYKTTGVTYQACNDPQEHTTITALVDVAFLPIIGQCGRLDWGVQPYNASASDNGGIVATAQYDDVRLHFSTRQASVLGHQVGIAKFDFQLWQPAKKADGTVIKCDGTQTLSGSVPAAAAVPPAVTYPPTTPGVYCLSGNDGSMATTTGYALQNYQSEQWGQPTDCTPRDASGNPLVTQQDAVPIPTATYHPQCIESSITGIAFGLGIDNPAIHGPQTVEGNYALGYTGQDPRGVGDWVVRAVSPGDTVLPPVNGKDRPLFTATTENEVNNYGVGQYIPQGADSSLVSWPPKAGPAYQMAQAPAGGYPENPGTYGPNPDPICAGQAITVKVTNPAFQAAGGSPFEGHTRFMCDAKLLHTEAGASIAPNFHFHTVNDVPLPTKFSGPIVDDVSISTDRRSTMLSDVQGLSNSPIGIYDWAGKLMAETNSDPNGQFEVIMPSSDTANCPNPSYGCPMVYRFVGNDPGQYGKPNLNYNPSYRTIAANFEAWPGMFAPADMAPTKAITSFAGQSVQFTAGPPPCAVAASDPQVLAVDQPYLMGENSRTLTIDGQGFGAARGTVRLLNRDNQRTLAPATWTDSQITVPLDGHEIDGGAYQLVITRPDGKTPTSSLTFHEVKGPYQPRVLEVGPGKAYTVIQAALEAAASPPDPTKPNALVVVYPNASDPNAPAFTPLGAYYENIIIHSPVKVQGVGPGGLRADGTAVPGTTIDGRYFWQTTIPETAANVAGGASEPYMLAWNTLASSLHFDGNQNIAGGEVVYVLGKNGQYKTSYKPAIDGFTITGGDSRDYPGNINELKVSGAGLPTARSAGIVEAQGGGIFLNAYADNFQVTNNVVQSNAGVYGAGIRVGTPYVSANLNHNHNVEIANNRLVANGGTNLAGGIGMFVGSDNYRIHDNELCGNHSSEYGGGISHFGLSPKGAIDHNRLFLNESVDEGGGIMVAGELQVNRTLSPGSGPVSIDHNFISANLAGDDGGGIRFLMAGNYPIDIYNNMITNNISAHEGGGIAIDDTPRLRIVNNTVAKNITTATAVTSNGQPAPAGISTTQNSTVLQSTLGSGAATFSDPLLFNDIFYDNRAGSWTAGGVVGIGQALDATPVNYWDIGSAGTGGNLSPTYSVLGSTQGYNNDPTNHVQQQGAATDNYPQFVAPYDIHVTVSPFRTYFKFRPSAIVSVDLPANVLGDYRLQAIPGPANNTGSRDEVGGMAPPVDDIDNRERTDAYEIGAAELPNAGGGGGGAAVNGGGVNGNAVVRNALTPRAAGAALRTSGSGVTAPAVGGRAAAPGGIAGSTPKALSTATAGNSVGGVLAARVISRPAQNALSLIVHSPATLTLGGLLVLALSAWVVYRRQHKGTSR